MRCVLILGSVLCLLSALKPGAVAEEPVERIIRVQGEGKANAAPDMATIQTGVVTQSSTAREALDGNNRAMQEIFSTLEAQQIAAKDIQTSNFNVQPEYKRGPRNQRTQEIIGYRVTNQLRVHVRNLPQLGAILDALVAAGSNQVSGISFGIDEPMGWLTQARQRAIADAKARAAVYAHAADVEVGPVISISEQSHAVPRAGPMPRAFAADAAAVPVAAGEQTVSVTVQVVFAIGNTTRE